jgi:hypothetical protein
MLFMTLRKPSSDLVLSFVLGFMLGTAKTELLVQQGT